MMAMSTVPTAAAIASASVCSPTEKSRSHARYSGNLCLPTTLSMMTFSGHGAARLIAVSNTIATKTMISQPRYGRTRSRTSLVMPGPPDFFNTSASGFSFLSLLDSSLIGLGCTLPPQGLLRGPGGRESVVQSSYLDGVGVFDRISSSLGEFEILLWAAWCGQKSY